MKKIIIFVFIFFCVSKVYCQSNFDTGFSPKVVLSNKVLDTINWVHSVES
jgi:hypothetical protein